MMTYPNPTRTIEDLEDAFRHNGYLVTASAIPGEEEAWAKTLSAAFTKMEMTLTYLQAHNGFRGKSKKAMAALHRALPCPDWGIEVREA